jgi:type II secretory ATPase GspE/PulE/Tfp pilus assembly ATPase PilB-like protein
LIGVINQRLIRQLCPDCRRVIETDEDLPVSDRVRSRLGDTTPQLYEADGCERCFGDGFVSLACLPEIMVVDKTISESIANRVSSGALETLAVEQGMLTLAEAAALRVFRGDTTAYEANRAVSDPQLAALASLTRRLSEH